MPGVRNGVLARRITSSDGVTILGTVPVGFTWLLKTVHVLNTGSGPEATVTLGMSAASGGVQASIWVWQLAPGAANSWSGWTALGPGDQVYVTAPAGIHVWAVGADLPGTIAEPFGGR